MYNLGAEKELSELIWFQLFAHNLGDFLIAQTVVKITYWSTV